MNLMLSLFWEKIDRNKFLGGILEENIRGEK